MLKYTIRTFAVAAILVSGSYVWADETFIDPEIVDIDAIRDEQQIQEGSELQRIYLFVAVLKDGVYETYGARGDVDADGDGANVLEEPNDITEYEEFGEFDRDLQIADDFYTCYISALPHFEDLFPDESDPIEQEGSWLEIDTETIGEVSENVRHLVGSRTLPLIDSMGMELGVEHFIAFYNADKESNQVKSYGFIGLQFMNQ